MLEHKAGGRKGGSEGEIYRRNPSQWQDSKLSRSMASSRWGEDEATMVDIGKLQLSDRDKTKMKRKPRPEKAEDIPCLIAGCDRMFVNNEELGNHLEIFHDTQSEQALEVLQHQINLPSGNSGTSDLLSNLVPLNSRREGDETIRPSPITEASLRALNDSTSTDLTQSFDDMSISDAHRSSESIMSIDTTYSVLDPVDEADFSDIAEPFSARIQLPVQILLCLWMKLVADLSRRLHDGSRQHANNASGSQHQTSANTFKAASATNSATSSQASGSRSSKRLLSEKHPLEDDDDERDGRPNKKKHCVSPENKPLACPFNKYDNYTFGSDPSNRSYHVCSTWNDVKTAYFKQHLLRNHCIPEYHCDRCGLDCRNPTDLRHHRRQDPPCEVKDLDVYKIMPETQQELGLKTRNTVGMDRVAYWFKVFDAVFGSEARRKRHIEPYYEGPLHEVLERFIRFSELRLPEVIRTSRQMLELDVNEYNDQDTHLVRTVLQEASHLFMAELQRQTLPSLREIKEENSPDSSAVDLGEKTVIAKDSKKQPTLQPNPYPFNVQHMNIQQEHPTTNSQPQATFQTMNLPTRPSNHPLPDVHHDPSIPSPFDYQQPMEYGEIFTADFEHFQPLMPELEATVEDSDMYGTGTLTQHDYEGFQFVENPVDPTRRERRLP